MDKEILYKLLLLGKLHDHRADYISDNAIELINPVNKIIVRIVSNDEIQIKYNYHEEYLIVILTSETVYNFFENLLTRNEANKITTKIIEPILIEKWKDELKDHIGKIEAEKNYNHYLNHMKLDSKRFEIEFYNNIIVIRDKKKQLLTNVFILKNAVQCCMK